MRRMISVYNDTSSRGLSLSPLLFVRRSHSSARLQASLPIAHAFPGPTSDYPAAPSVVDVDTISLTLTKHDTSRVDRM
eukprot:m.133421 g.133421  ORF g.133421 m.133421 type:complete len:78 (-) comp22500_c0_seq1:402-635(-)